MNTSLKILRWESIDPKTKAKLEEAPLIEWGDISFIRETKWATPDWSIFLLDEEEEIISFVNIIERVALFDNKKVKVGGINNLITNKKYRSRGLSKTLMEKTQDFIIEELNCECGLLLCANKVAKFYEKLDWLKFDGNLQFSQPKKQITWHQNTYLYKFEEPDSIKIINLNGFPW